MRAVAVGGPADRPSVELRFMLSLRTANVSVQPLASTTDFPPKLGASLHLYLREVFYNELNKGVSGRMISLRVVDATGDPVEGVSLQPSVVTTDTKGFGTPIVISSNAQGVFLIEARFLDKRAQNVSYSMPIWFRNGGAQRRVKPSKGTGVEATKQ